MVQVVQDGRWWRATVQGLAHLDGAPFDTKAVEGDIAPTLVLQLIARPDAPPLRVCSLHLLGLYLYLLN